MMKYGFAFLMLFTGLSADAKSLALADRHFFYDGNVEGKDKQWYYLTSGKLAKAKVSIEYRELDDTHDEGYYLESQLGSEPFLCSSSLKEGPVFKLKSDGTCWDSRVARQEIYVNKKTEHRCPINWKKSDLELRFTPTKRDDMELLHVTVYVEGKAIYAGDSVELYDLDHDEKIDAILYSAGEKGAGDSYDLYLSSGGSCEASPTIAPSGSKSPRPTSRHSLK